MDFKGKEICDPQIEVFGGGWRSVELAAQGGLAEASGTGSAGPTPGEQEKEKRLALPDSLDDGRVVKRMFTRKPITKEGVDMLRIFAGKKEHSLITTGAYKAGCRMKGDGSSVQHMEEAFLGALKSIKQAAAQYVKEYDAKGFVEGEPTICETRQPLVN